jgi:hypothetical protein
LLEESQRPTNMLQCEACMRRITTFGQLARVGLAVETIFGGPVAVPVTGARSDVAGTQTSSSDWRPETRHVCGMDMTRSCQGAAPVHRNADLAAALLLVGGRAQAEHLCGAIAYVAKEMWRVGRDVDGVPAPSGRRVSAEGQLDLRAGSSGGIWPAGVWRGEVSVIAVSYR